MKNNGGGALPGAQVAADARWPILRLFSPEHARAPTHTGVDRGSGPRLMFSVNPQQLQTPRRIEPVKTHAKLSQAGDASPEAGKSSGPGGRLRRRHPRGNQLGPEEPSDRDAGRGHAGPRDRGLHVLRAIPRHVAYQRRSTARGTAAAPGFGRPRRAPGRSGALPGPLLRHSPSPTKPASPWPRSPPIWATGKAPRKSWSRWPAT